MKWGWFAGKARAKANSLKDPENLANLLMALSGKWDTPALIAYLADERTRLLLCKALISPVSGSDRQLARRALHILRSRGMDPEPLKKRLEPAALALGLVSPDDVQIDYYDVLGVKPSATPEELRAAYRKKAFELHPDTARGTKEESAGFVTLQIAYDTLMDPNSRAAFDRCQVQLDSWRELRPGENSSEGVRRRPAGNLRKTGYRIAAVVAVMVVIAWVMNIFYESESMLELVQVTSSTEPGPTRKMTGTDIGQVENKMPVLSEVIEDKAAPKPEPKKPAREKSAREKPASKKPAPKKSIPRKPEPKKSEPKKSERASLKTAGLAAPEPVEVRKPVKAQAPVVRESRKKKLKPVLKPAKAKVMEIPEVAKKKQPDSATPVPLKSPEKPVAPVKQASIPSAPGSTPGIRSSSIDKVQTRKPEPNVSATAQAQAPAALEHPAPPQSSIHAVITDSPVHVFPDTPVPKTHKTLFIKRSQILDFLKKYTADYERGNGEAFFSYFTANAMENGKPQKTFRPGYLEFWDKVQHLDYRIYVNETEQVIGSDTLSMKGQFDLVWEFFDGQSGQGHGEIFMDLKLNKDVLLISRLDYRFDE